MNCPLEFVRQDGNRFVHRCLVCKTEVSSKYRDPAARHRACGKASLPAGPGTEFRRVRMELRIKEKCGGKCAALEAEMNEAGVAGCRERRDYFLSKIRENAKDYGLTDWAVAGFFAVIQGKPWTIEGLFDLAIERAHRT